VATAAVLAPNKDSKIGAEKMRFIACFKMFPIDSWQATTTTTTISYCLQIGHIWAVLLLTKSQ
jgi:hypothetical protein